VNLNLAYRWFCRLDLSDWVPDHSTCSKSCNGRFRDSELLRHLFETTVVRCIAEGLDALLRNEPHRERAGLERIRDLMDRATRDCLVTGYEALVPALTLLDPDDWHVLAAAIVGRCDAITTQNLKNFPP
jgi:hypothetical protein